MKTQRTINAPAHHVLDAIADYGRTNFPKVDITRHDNAVTFFRKVMWQKQTATFTIEDDTLTIEAEAMDAQKWAYRTLGSIDNLLDDAGWANAAHTHGIKSTKNILVRNRVLEELSPGERISIAVMGMAMKKNSTIVVTDRRVLLVEDSALGTVTGSRTVGLEKISAVNVESGVMYGEVEIVTSNESIKVEKILGNEAEALARVLREKLDAPKATSTTSAAPAGYIDQLAQLAELRAQGVLTDEEFAAAKSKVLGL